MTTSRQRRAAALLAMLLPLWAMVLTAAPITKGEARGVAERFLSNAQAGRQKLAGKGGSVSLTAAETAFIGKAADKLYVFDIDRDRKAGYVVVSGDSDYGDVLGWTDRGNFEKDNVPPALLFLMNVYAEEMELGLAAKGDKSNPEIFQREPIAPLTKSKWNQDYPYNALCPDMGSTTGGKPAPTGCVATAFAQLMYFHKWPEKGTGNYDGADFGNTTYEWDKMYDEYDSDKEYTDEEVNAIATLMSHVGVASNMDYGPYESGAYSTDAATALYKNFGYNLGSYLQRNYCNGYEFLDAVYRELALGRPVIYEGRDVGGGHQFICDGYDENLYFHINWGWGGYCDGWYKLTALNPSIDGQGIGSNGGSYNMSQGIWTGITPCKSGENVSKPWGSLRYFYDGEDGAGISTALEFNSTIKDAYTADVALMCINTKDGKQTIVEQGQLDVSTNRSATWYYWDYYGVNIPFDNLDELEDGTYRVYIMAKNSLSEDDWAYFVYKNSYQNSYKLLEVKDGEARIIEAVSPTITIEDVRIGKNNFLDMPLDVTVDYTIHDADLEEYVVWGAVQEIATGEQTSFTILLKGIQGETTTVKPVMTMMSYYYSPGMYKVLIFRDNEDDVIYESEEFEILAGGSGSPELTLAERYTLNPCSSVKDKISMEAELKCDGGRYVGDVYFAIIEWLDNGTGKYAATLPMTVVANDGETVTISEEFDLTGLKLTPDKVYGTRLLDRNLETIMPWENTCVSFCYDAQTFVDLTDGSTQVPDAAFRNLLQETYDHDCDYMLTNLEMNDVEIWECYSMEIEGEDIKSIQGVEYFKLLKYLTVYNTSVEYLSMTAGQPIEQLSLSNNKIRKIDFEALPKLNTLRLYTNAVAALELPNGDMDVNLYAQKRGLPLDDNGDCDLAELTVDGFKADKVLESKGISFEGGKIHVDDLKTQDVWYTYDAGYGKELRVEIFNTNAPKQEQSIVWEQSTSGWTPGEVVELTAYATSRISVSYELVSGPGSIKDNWLTINDYGTFEITAYQNGNDEYQAAEPVTMTFVVSEMQVQSITLDFTELVLEPGDVMMLHATVEPAGAEELGLTWLSSDTEIATVSDRGKVTAKSVGTAVITVMCDDKEATCTVTVKKASGIDELEGEAEAEYFTLEGHRVSGTDLEPGIYLRRTGDKVEKVLVR